METPTAFPKTLLEAIKYFQNPDACLSFLRDLRWPNGVVCPTCGSREVTFLANARLWKCRTKHPRQKFSIKVGTIFEDSPIPLEKWLAAIWMVAGCKNGISSCEMARDLGVTQKTAWFINHRVRLAMHDGSFEKMSGKSKSMKPSSLGRRGTCTSQHANGGSLVQVISILWSEPVC